MSSMAIEPIEASAPNGQASAQWVIVTQVKSDRIVYFTDDMGYQPPADGDWCYVSGFAGALPEGMTLRNCWGWRFNGGVFVDARDPETPPVRERLLEHNRNALLRLLNDKIDAVRAPLAPTSRDGYEVRRMKLAQAQHYRQAASGKDAAAPTGGFGLLEAVAVARRISMMEAAALVEHKAQRCQRVWEESERFREQMTQAIGQADSEAQLLELRTWLLDKVYPALTERFKVQVDDTVPADPDAPLNALHREHEIARLKAQLREAVNKKRAPIASDYLQNDDVRKQKVRLAQAVLANLDSKRRPTEGIDADLLAGYADAREVDLATAARLVLKSSNEAARVLVETERIRDQMLARIESISTLRDIHRLDTALAAVTDSREFNARESRAPKPRFASQSTN